MKWLMAAMALLLASLTVVVCDAPEEQREFTNDGRGGGDYEFKVPVPKGYDWEVSQSWAEHCEECDERYPVPPYDPPLYCASSHMDDCCKYGWDFNLTGNSDRGKPVLASSDGVVKSAGWSNGWGNTVLVDHGNNLCTRYAHMLDDSLTVADGDIVCQGLKLGEIGKTGGDWGEHLHFQFEDCRTHEGLERGFSDGNGVPMCAVKDGIYDEDHHYIALKLTNDLRENCENDEDFGDGELPEGGWREAECGGLSGCPLRPNCGREAGHKFDDNREMDQRTRDAVAYLYSECAVDGKADGDFDPNTEITRAEALKIAMYLFDRIDEDCEEVEDFHDVYRSDWFYNLVNCGIEQGVVSDGGEYFRPNDAITFAEAAKFAVVPAVKAGVIRLQNPSEGHFYMIPESHWAYRYVETLYYYGALVTDASYYGPDDTQSRRQFAIIAASLSPCFCANVACEYPCQCEQSTFSCTDPEDEDPGEGGGDDDDDDDDLEFDLEIEAFVEEDEIECEGDKTSLYIKVTIENSGDEDLQINDLVLKMTDSNDEDICYVSDPNLHTGVGVQVIEAGETRTPNGHYEIVCDEMPDDGEIEVSFDLKEKVDGEITWYEDLLEAEIPLEEGFFGGCGTTTSTTTTTTTTVPGTTTTKPSTTTTMVTTTTRPSTTTTTVPPGWEWENCDPFGENQVRVLVLDGEFEMITSSDPPRYIHIASFPDNEMTFPLSCEDFPVAVLTKSLPSGWTNIEFGVGSQPMANYWSDYVGGITLTPSIPPDGVTQGFGTFGAHATLFTSPSVYRPWLW